MDAYGKGCPVRCVMGFTALLHRFALVKVRCPSVPASEYREIHNTLGHPLFGYRLYFVYKLKHIKKFELRLGTLVPHPRHTLIH